MRFRIITMDIQKTRSNKLNFDLCTEKHAVMVVSEHMYQQRANSVPYTSCSINETKERITYSFGFAQMLISSRARSVLSRYLDLTSSSGVLASARRQRESPLHIFLVTYFIRLSWLCCRASLRTQTSIQSRFPGLHLNSPTLFRDTGFPRVTTSSLHSLAFQSLWNRTTMVWSRSISYQPLLVYNCSWHVRRCEALFQVP